MSNGPSPHLSWTELRCADGTEYPAAWRLTRAIDLARAFELIRGLWGLPIAITSAYRTREHNKAVGGAAQSQHCEGRALDLKPPEGVPVQDFWEDIVRLAPRAGVTGIGYASVSKGGYVHIDVRPSPNKAPKMWRY